MGAVRSPSIDMLEYTAPRAAPAFLPYQNEVAAEMRTLRGARSYEMNEMVRSAPSVNFVKHAVRPVIPNLGEAGVKILDADAKVFTEPYSPTVASPIKEAE